MLHELLLKLVFLRKDKIKNRKEIEKLEKQIKTDFNIDNTSFKIMLKQMYVNIAIQKKYCELFCNKYIFTFSELISISKHINENYTSKQVKENLKNIFLEIENKLKINNARYGLNIIYKNLV